MSAHTPGPWRLVVSSRSWQNPFQIERSDGACLFSFGESPFHECGEADARLIAAAPELLAALQQIQRMGYTDFGDRLMVDAAIAKATQP